MKIGKRIYVEDVCIEGVCIESDGSQSFRAILVRIFAKLYFGLKDDTLYIMNVLRNNL